MRRLLPALSLALCLATLSYGQMKVKAEREYEPFKKIVLKASDVTSKSAQFLWDVSGDSEPDTHEDGGTLYVWAAPGRYRVRLTAIDFEAKKVERATFSFTVTGKVPQPPPDIDPPGPGPTPTPAPVKSLRVLIVEESAKRTSLPQGQQLIITGKTFRDYMKTRGTVDAENPYGPFRAWDKDADTKKMPAAWKTLFDRPRTSVPWVVIEADGKVRHEGPLEKDKDAQIKKIEEVAPSNKSRSARPLSLRKAG